MNIKCFFGKHDMRPVTINKGLDYSFVKIGDRCARCDHFQYVPNAHQIALAADKRHVREVSKSPSQS